MKYFVKSAMALVLLFAVVLVNIPNTASAQNAGVISAVLNKMESNYKDLKSLRSAISMEKWDNQIKRSDKVGGWVLYLPAKGRNANFRVDWTTPIKETLSVVDGQYLLCRYKLNTCYQGKNKDGAKQSGALSFLNMSTTQLKSSFDFKDAFNETLWGGINTTHFTLYPKTKTNYQYAEVWVDGNGMPIQSKVVEHNGDATTIRLLNVERNIPLNVDQLKLKIDSSIKVVKT